jgi:transposase
MEVIASNTTAHTVEALQALLAATQTRLIEAEEKLGTTQNELAVERAERSDDRALIAHLKLVIAKMKREKFGPRSEKSERLLNQLELQLEDLEATATEDELAAEKAAQATTNVKACTRKKPARKPFPEHLPRERVIVPGPTSCACCGGARLVKLGEDVTETLESVPRQWKVVQTVREKFTCRDCESISQSPAPFHAIPRGFAGPSLLAMILFEKYGQHQPLNRQSERYAREGVDLSLSTLADLVGAGTFALAPLAERIARKISKALPARRCRQSHELHAQALGRLCPLHRRRANMPDQQRRRTSDQTFGSREKIVALLRFRSWRSTRGHDVQSHYHGQNERY